MLTLWFERGMMGVDWRRSKSICGGIVFERKRFILVLALVLLPLVASPLLAIQEADLDRMIPILNQVKEQEMQSWREWIAWEKVHAGRQHEIDSRYVEIDLDIFFDGDSIGATVQTRFLSLTNGLSEVKLEFEDAYAVDSVFGNGTSFTLLGETLTVTLDQPYDSNETFSIATTYHGVPPLVGGLKGFRFEHHQGIPIAATLCTPFLAHLWWPCVDGPADKLDSVHIRITVPDTSYAGYPLYAASNGKLVGITSPAPGYLTYEWHENYPIPLLSLRGRFHGGSLLCFSGGLPECRKHLCRDRGHDRMLRWFIRRISLCTGKVLHGRTRILRSHRETDEDRYGWRSPRMVHGCGP
jgi:hypothetical protein